MNTVKKQIELLRDRPRQKECTVRWKESGISNVCGHPLPCPKHPHMGDGGENQAIWEALIKIADNIDKLYYYKKDT